MEELTKNASSKRGIVKVLYKPKKKVEREMHTCAHLTDIAW